MVVERVIPQLYEDGVVIEDDEDFEGIRSAEDPILSRAGVLDISRSYAALPKEKQVQFGLYPNIDTWRLGNYIFELTAFELQRLELAEYRFGRDEKHHLYPVVRDGYIHDLAETRLFHRLFGIHQLGLTRYYPLRNPQTRAEHSIHMTINNVRVLRALYEHDSDELMNKLRDDFVSEGLCSQNHIADERLLELAGDVIVLSSMLHDAAMPAGGDTIKNLMDIDEEEELYWLFNQARVDEGEDNGVLGEEIDELMDLLERWNLDKRHIDYAIKCIRGHSDTLIGQMINPKDADEVDLDRISYTLLDGQAADLLSVQEVPDVLLPKWISESEAEYLRDRLHIAVDTLKGDYAKSSKQPGTMFVPVNLIDCSEDFRLTDGRMVCTRPDKLAWLAAYRIWMTGYHYYGVQMLAPEIEFQQHLERLTATDGSSPLLNRERLIQMTDAELMAACEDLDDPELNEIIERNSARGGMPIYYGVIVSKDDEPAIPNIIGTVPINIKPGLDSLVFDDGEVISLREWIQRYPQLLASQKIQEGIETFRDIKLVIGRKSDVANLLIMLSNAISS